MSLGIVVEKLRKIEPELPPPTAESDGDATMQLLQQWSVLSKAEGLLKGTWDLRHHGKPTFPSQHPGHKQLKWRVP